MTHDKLPILITFIGYITIVLVIGVFASRVTRNLSDFVLGGRRLSPVIAALGAGASDMSGWLLMALPGAVFVWGLKEIWIPVGLTIGAYLNWRLVARRLRIATEKLGNALTIPAYFNYRFRDHNPLLRTTTALVIIVFFTFYASAGFVSSAVLLNSIFGIDYMSALIIGASVMVIYTCVGGFLAVSWVDFFQGSLMFFALMIVPFMTFHAIHIPSHYAEVMNRLPPYFFNPFHHFSVLGFISLLAWGFGYFGQPHILVRFMAIKSPDGLLVARRICMTWMTLSLVGAVLTGLSGAIYFKGRLAEPEAVFLYLANILFNPWMAGILISAVLSAIMSVVSAQLLASASAVTEDIYHALFKKNLDQKRLVLIGRMTVVGIALVAAILASNPKSNILQLVAYAWSGLGASFGPIILMSLYWKRMTSGGAMAGMIAGALTVILWHYLGNKIGGIFQLYEIVPAFLMNLGVSYIFSLAFPDPNLKQNSGFSAIQWKE